MFTVSVMVGNGPKVKVIVSCAGGVVVMRVDLKTMVSADDVLALAALMASRNEQSVRVVLVQAGVPSHHH